MTEKPREAERSRTMILIVIVIVAGLVGASYLVQVATQAHSTTSMNTSSSSSTMPQSTSVSSTTVTQTTGTQTSSHTTSYPTPYVEYTLFLPNNTLYHGNASPPNGLDPGPMAVDPKNGFVYVADLYPGTLSVIVGTSERSYKTFYVGGALAGLAFDPVSEELYVANYFSNNVTVLNPDSGAFIANVTVAPPPAAANDYTMYSAGAIVADPSNGELYVSITGHTGTMSATGWVSAVDGATNRVVANITSFPVASRFIGPGDLTFDSSNGCVYVVDQVGGGGLGGYQPPGYGFVTVINGSDNQAVANVKTAANLVAIAFDWRNKDIYAVSGTGSMTVIDGTTNMVMVNATIGSGASDATFDPYNLNDPYMYIAEPNWIEVVNVTSLTVKTTIVTGSPNTDLAFSNSVLYSSHGLNSTVSEIEVDNIPPVVGTTVLGAQPWKVVMNPDGGNVFVENVIRSSLDYVVATATHLIATTINASSYPALRLSFENGAYDAENGYYYLPGTTSDDVLVLNGTTGSTVTSVAVAYSPEALAFDSRNNLIYVFFENQEYQVINGTNNEPGGTYAVFTVPGNGFNGAVFDSQNGCIYAYGPDSVAVINGSTNGIAAIIPSGYSYLAYNPVNGLIYGTDISGTVDIINPSTNHVLSSLEVGSNPYGLAVDFMTGYVYVANTDSGTLSIIAP